jgi:Fe-S-cluster containining protein
MASGLALLRFHCTRCGDCCRHVRVPLTHADLARLFAHVSTPAHDLVEFLSAAEIDMTGEPETQVLLDSGSCHMLLRHARESCAFLDESGSCGVYEARPVACRTYPIVATFGRRGGVRRLRLLRGSECEATRDGRVDVATLRSDTERQADELREYANVVSEWNRLQRHRARLGHPLATSQDFVGWLLGKACP